MRVLGGTPHHLNPNHRFQNRLGTDFIGIHTNVTQRMAAWDSNGRFLLGDSFLYTALGVIIKAQAPRLVGQLFGTLSADVDDVLVHRGYRALLVGRVHGHLRPIGRGGHSEDQFRCRDVAANSRGLSRVHRAKLTSVTVSAENYRMKESHTLRWWRQSLRGSGRSVSRQLT